MIEVNTVTVTGGVKQHQSPWMLTDAANIIFQTAQRRCYVITSTSKPKSSVIDLTEDEEAWAALDEAELGTTANASGRGKEKETTKRPKWLPDGLEPVLEELPKWNLLSEVILEAEGEMIRQESTKKPNSSRKHALLHRFLSSELRLAQTTSSNIVLVMTSSTRTCNVLTNFLSTMNRDALPGSRGRSMMMLKLRSYLWWKKKSNEEKQANKGQSTKSNRQSPSKSKDLFDTIYGDNDAVSEALKKKDKEKAQRAQNRRRVRGGAPHAAGAGGHDTQPAFPKPEPKEAGLYALQNEADEFTQL